MDACDRAIPELKAQGYEFVNLPDLFKKCGVEPKNKNPSGLWLMVLMEIRGENNFTIQNTNYTVYLIPLEMPF